jgi:outer membrane protein TolC
MIKLNKSSLRLLKLFYGHPDDSFYIQQIGRIIKKKPGVFQRTLYALEKDGVLKSEYKANARFFRANKEYVIYKELKGIISKSAVIALVFILSFSLVSPGRSAFCEEKPPLGKVFLRSLEEAVVMAYRNNRDIQAQEKQIAVAKADILGARSAFLPNLDLNAGYTRNGDVLRASTATASKKDYGVFGGYKNNNRLGLSLDEMIYNGGADIAAFKQARLVFDEQLQTLRAVKLNVEFETRRLYYGLLLGYETRRIAENLVTQAQAHYEDTKRKFEQGTASRFDVLQSKVQVSLLMPELINALNAIDLIQAELNKLLGLNVQDSIVIEDEMQYFPIAIEEDEFLKQAYLHKPEMILQSLGIDVNKWGIRLAKSGWLPQVSAGAEYFYQSNNTANMFNTRHNNWNVGVSVSLPIFDGFATKAKVDAARALYAQSLITRENVSDQIAVDVRKACLDLRQAASIISSQEDNLEDAREALKISNVRYDNGIGINLDVLDAQVSLAQVEENLAQGIYDYLMAQAQLDRTMGKEFLTAAEEQGEEQVQKSEDGKILNSKP